MRNSELEQKELTKAKNAAYRYLTCRPRSRREVESKLREKHFSAQVVDAIISSLEQLGYINDHEFARQWARSRTRLRGLGRLRIEQELRDKGVSREIIRESLFDVFEGSSEAEIAWREAEKKLKNLTRCEPEVQRRRLAGFLERKGFASDIIRKILNDIP